MKKKIIRVTTADISLDGLLEGQLRFLNQYYDVVGLAADTGVLDYVSRREGIRVINVPMHREISVVNDIRSLRSLYKTFKREKPWMVHANTPKGSLLAMAAAWMARVPRRVYTVTGLRYQGAKGVLRLILKSTERLSCCFATHVIPEGQGVLHALQADRITRKPLKVLWFGNINGRDTRHFSRRQTVADLLHKPYSEVTDDDVAEERNLLRRNILRCDDACGQRCFVFVFVGRITNDKGMRELAKSMQDIAKDSPQVRLLLVGDMEKGDAIPDAVRNYFVTDKNVTYAGEQRDVRPYLLAADALVFPSYREGFPNVPIEAGAMGLASIVTNINGSNEIIKDGLNGKIIEAPLDGKGRHAVGMQQALESTMRWFVEHPQEVRRMSLNAPRMIHERYEQTDVWKALLEYYRSLEG